MNKLILAAVTAAVALPGIASAQSAAELRHDNRDVREARREAHQAYRYGDQRDIRDAQHNLKMAGRERREDWQDYRDSHPDRFRGGAYAGPRGYAYRPVNVGYRFAPEYYGQRYRIDPVQYRLAPAPRYQRYVRYGNDVVLVDRGGRVVRVYNGFFR